MSPIKHNECESEIRVDVSLNTSDAVPGISEAFNDYTRGSKIEEEEEKVEYSEDHEGQGQAGYHLDLIPISAWGLVSHREATVRLQV